MVADYNFSLSLNLEEPYSMYWKEKDRGMLACEKKVCLTSILSRVKAIKLTRLNLLICIQRKTVFRLMMSNFEFRCNFNITSTCHGYFMWIKGLETVEQRRCENRNTKIWYKPVETSELTNRALALRWQKANARNVSYENLNLISSSDILNFL